MLPDEGGTLISGDVLHHWAHGRGHFNWVGHIGFRLIGFIGPHAVGKGWLDVCEPDPGELESLLQLPFVHVLPAHGDVVLGDAASEYRPAVVAYAEKAGRPSYVSAARDSQSTTRNECRRSSPPGADSAR